jgi:SOS response regulatory protein OraA/RecX
MSAGRAGRRAGPDERRAARATLTSVGPVLDAAARLLEVRPRAAGEVRRRLLAAGFPPALVEAAIVRLIAAGYLDDEAFARVWVESRDRARPRGEAALRRELLARGVAAETANAILSERRARGTADGERPRTAADGAGVYDGVAAGGMDGQTGEDVDAAAARRLLERRGRGLLREPDPRRRRDRAYSMLARAGFDPDTCREAVLAWLADMAGEDGREELGPDGV